MLCFIECGGGVGGGVSLRAHAEASFLPEGPAIEWVYINRVYLGVSEGELGRE